jgi:predicted transcriptional regulator of viral defense system
MRTWLAAGLTRAQFRTRVRSGELVQLGRGVYSTAKFAEQAAEGDILRHIVRIAVATGSQHVKDAVASHQSAAIVHGIDLLNEPEDDTVWLTRPPGRYRNGGVRGVRFHSARVPEEHVDTVLGIPVTTPARTLIDLARSLPYMDGVVAVDSALHKATATKADLLTMLEFFHGWPGAATARKAVGFGDSRSESPLESAARVVFDQYGLPAPQPQANILGEGFRFVGRVDFCWERYKTIAEADGMAKYEDPEKAQEQIRRDIGLRAAGYKVVHFTWAELFAGPATVIARIRKAFETPSAF